LAHSVHNLASIVHWIVKYNDFVTFDVRALWYFEWIFQCFEAVGWANHLRRTFCHP